MVTAVTAVDPFELPEWLGEEPVTWRAETSMGAAHLVAGELTPDRTGPGEERSALRQVCDLLACDLAYPLPVLNESWRHDAHQAWTLREVLLVERAGRLTLVVPGTAVTAEPALEAVRRLARAMGAQPSCYTVALRL